RQSLRPRIRSPALALMAKQTRCGGTGDQGSQVAVSELHRPPSRPSAPLPTSQFPTLGADAVGVARQCA
ncbi:hypothetical protein P7K49_039276, partial [Saguinus oedipus]